MRTGFRFAERHDYDVAVQIDADGQHDPRYVREMLPLAGDARRRRGGTLRLRESDPYVVRGPRRWAMVLLAGCRRALRTRSLTDVTSGFRLANRRAISVFAAHYPAEYLGDTVESLVIASRTGCRIVQYPVVMRVRSAGRASQSPFRASIYLLRAVAALGLALVRRWPSSFDEGVVAGQTRRHGSNRMTGPSLLGASSPCRSWSPCSSCSDATGCGRSTR